MNIKLKIYGKNSEEVLNTFYNLAITFYESENYQITEEYFLKYLDIRKKINNESHEKSTEKQSKIITEL